MAKKPVSAASETTRKSRIPLHIDILNKVLAQRASETKGYSMRSFAAELGLDPGTLSRILRGQRTVSYTVGLGLSGRLGLSDSAKTEFMKSVEGDFIRAKKGGDGAKLENPEKELTPEQIARKKEVEEAKTKLNRAEVLNLENKIIFVTTVVQGAEVDRRFLASVENFIARRNSKFFIMSSRAHLKPLTDDEYPLDEIILSRYSDNVYRKIEVNRHLHLSNLDIRPYRTDPLSGKQELGATEGRSYIFAHTQQRFKTYPNGIGGIARVQATTGALTVPLYRDNESGELGDYRHKIGGVIIEIKNSRFHIRQVEADVDGSFIDMGVRYCSNGTIEKAITEAMIRGDDHVGFQDALVQKAMAHITKMLGPKRIFIHDLTDAASVSHHRERSLKAMHSLPENIDTLAKELKENRRFLEDMNRNKPAGSEIFIVPSNHNEHVHKYLDEGRWLKDRQNFKTALELAYFYYIKNKDPLIQALDPEEKLATWLRRGDVVKVCGIHCSSHGDAGANGAKGSIKSDAVAFGHSTSGHSHMPEKYRNATRTGTSSVLGMDYTHGAPSSWAHAFELIYLGRGSVGQRQLIMVIGGHFTTGQRALEKLYREAARPNIIDMKRSKEAAEIRLEKRNAS